MSEQQDNPNLQHANPNQNYPYYYPQASPAFYPFYNANQFPQQRQQTQPPQMQGTGGQGQSQGQGTLPLQQSYIENILRLNRGKLATVYMTFEGANAKTFKGIVEAAGRDHIIISDPQTGKRYLLLMVYLDYITFDEEINYAYPFDGGQMATNAPRK